MKESTDRLINSLREQGHSKILFVCLGNICRSPAAEGVMQAIIDSSAMPCNISVDSAGTGNYHIGQLPDRRMRIHARNRGYDLTHHCRQICMADFQHFDLIIGMDSMNISDLRDIAPSVEAERKIVAMSEFFSPSASYDYVPDPYYEGAEGFELVLDLLEDSCRNLFNLLTKQSPT